MRTGASGVSSCLFYNWKTFIDRVYNCAKPLFQSEANYEAIVIKIVQMKVIFI